MITVMLDNTLVKKLKVQYKLILLITFDFISFRRKRNIIYKETREVDEGYNGMNNRNEANVKEKIGIRSDIKLTKGRKE